MTRPAVHSFCVDPDDPRTADAGGLLRRRLADRRMPRRQLARRPRRACMRSSCRPSEPRIPRSRTSIRLVQCRAAPQSFWAQHHNGVFRSTDGAARPGRRSPPSGRPNSASPWPSTPRTRNAPGSCRRSRTSAAFPADGAVVVARTDRRGPKVSRFFAEACRSAMPMTSSCATALAIDRAGQWPSPSAPPAAISGCRSDQGERWQLRGRTSAAHPCPRLCRGA